MKRIVACLLVLTALALGVNAENTTYDYGYRADTVSLQDTLYSGTIKTAVISGYRSSKYATNHYGLLEMPQKETTAFDGCQIDSICFCPFITNNTNGYIIISNEIGGTPLYIQETTVKSHEWSRVKLDTPFKITAGQHLYIGYRIQATGSDWPIGYYYTSNVMKATQIDPIIDYVAYEKSDGTVMSGMLDTQTYTARRQTANLMLYAAVSGNIPTSGLSLDQLTLSKGQYIHTTDAQTLSTTITNVGTDSISSFGLTVTLDGTNVVSGTQEVPVAPLWERTFNLNIPAMSAGLHKINVTVDKPNGKANTYKGTTSMNKEFLVYADSLQKVVLVEHFTTARCVNCVAGDSILRDYISKSNIGTDYVQVNHHSGFTHDALTTDQDAAYEWFYGTDKGGSMWAPANMVDRRDFTAYGAKGYGGKATTGPIHGTSGAKTDSLLNVAHRTPAFITLNVKPVLKNGNITVSVTGTTLYNLPQAEKKRLNVFLVEDSVIYPQANADSIIQNYSHMNVMRKSLTGTWGQAEVIDNQTISKIYTCAMDEAWNAAHLRAVAFIADYDSTDNTNCQVMQAAQAKVQEIEVVELPYSEDTSTIQGAMSTNKYGYTPHGWMYMTKYGAWIYSYATSVSGFVGKAYLYTNKQVHLPQGTIYFTTTGTAIGDDVYYEVYIAPEYKTDEAMQDFSTLVGKTPRLRNVLNTGVVDSTIIELSIPEEGDYIMIIRPHTEVKNNQMTIATLSVSTTTPTGITAPYSQPLFPSDDASGKGSIYNLQGQKIADGYRGIAISNGKKIIKK